MKSKKFFLPIIISLAVLVALSAIVYMSRFRDMDAARIDASVRDQEAKKAVSLGATPASETVDFYQACLEKSKTQDQKDAIDKLMRDTSLGVGYFKRAALLITGELPRDQKRLTLDSAKQALGGSAGRNDLAAVLQKFNAIAGAPDFDGGSGVYLIIYYLNDEKTEAIYVYSSTVIDYVTIGADGKLIRKPLTGTRAVPAPSLPVPESTAEPMD